MKTEDSSNKTDKKDQSTEKLIGRREALNKAGVYALSATTMMILMKSQPAMAQSDTIKSPALLPTTNTKEGWERTTTRTTRR